MDKQQQRFDEQDHPLKNTDQAFVQVGSEGQPVIPSAKTEDKEKDSVPQEPEDRS